MDTTRLVYTLTLLVLLTGTLAYVEHGKASYLKGQMVVYNSFVPDGSEGMPYPSVAKKARRGE